MDVSVSGTIDQKTYLKKFRGGFNLLNPPWIRLRIFSADWSTSLTPGFTESSDVNSETV